VNRLEGAEEKLQEMGVRLTSVTTIQDIADALHAAGLVDDSTLEAVVKQIASSGGSEIY